MSSMSYIFIFSVIFLHLSNAQRRILEGKQISTNRRYVVYLIKADPKVKYDAWICGGAIVSKWYIVTSAACVEDVKHMYAIAGYKKYVPYESINEDPCTRSKKKKIVYLCIPSAYSFDYPRVDRWANIDIALAKVDSAYDFEDCSYETVCMYKPAPIEINYNIRLQDPGTNAIVFGWGHVQKWRDEADTSDYNQDYLLYGSVRLASKDKCKEYFDDVNIKTIIDKYMVCTLEEGNLDDEGGLINGQIDPRGLKTNCAPGNTDCVPASYYRRKETNMTNYSGRRKGICQNDHGGPMVTWRGPKEVLIGLASVFRVQEGTKACIGPFLYTSTYCNGAFLHCLLDTRGSNMEDCYKSPKERGYEIIRRTISWIGHPDGPADNEVAPRIQKAVFRADNNDESKEANPSKNNESKKQDVSKDEKFTHKTEQINEERRKSDLSLKMEKIPDRKSEPLVNHKYNADKNHEVTVKFRDILKQCSKEEETPIRIRPQIPINQGKK